MTHPLRDRVVALAGVYQAAYLVHQIATRGMSDSAALEASINSIFKIDAADVDAVFGDIGGVVTGLSTLRKQLSEQHPDSIHITQYVVALLHLERKLARKPELLKQLSDGITQAGIQAQHFHTTHENVLARLADLYKNTISTLTPRIMVQGEHGHLNNPTNADKVRAVLLAGIRAAVLWNQCGGSRWQILFRRSALLDQAQKLLAELRQ